MATPKPIGIKRRKSEAILHNYMELGHIAIVGYVLIRQVQMFRLRIVGSTRFLFILPVSTTCPDYTSEYCVQV